MAVPPWIAALFFCFCFIPLSLAADPAESLVSRMENARGFWTILTAETRLLFRVPDKKETATALCTLTYQRLNEQILLNCRQEATARSVFTLATDDRSFQLHLAARNTVFTGDILYLEYSPEIESHLRPLDLLRALKPMLPYLKGLKITKESERGTFVEERSGITGALRREILVTPSGDVLRETYISPEGREETVIRRYDFRPIGKSAGRYPYKILIRRMLSEDEDSFNETIFIFQKIDFSDSATEGVPGFIVPEGTRREKIGMG